MKKVEEGPSEACLILKSALGHTTSQETKNLSIRELNRSTYLPSLIIGPSVKIVNDNQKHRVFRK